MTNRKNAQQNAKYKCLRVEEIKVGTSYSFSYNPSDQPCSNSTNNGFKYNAFHDWSHDSLKIFEKLKYCAVHIYLDVSNKARFHYHGTIIIKDVINFIVKDLPKLRFLGTYEIDTIEDINKWDEYCRKLYNQLSDFCLNNDMIIEYDNTD